MNKNILKTEKRKAQIFGHSADLVIFHTTIGVLKEFTIICSDDEREILISKAVKNGFPFGKIEKGVQIFN